MKIPARLVDHMHKVWVCAVLYVFSLIILLGYVFTDIHVGEAVGVIFSLSVMVAFGVVLLWPVTYLIIRRGKGSRALRVAGWATISGYVLLGVQMLYVRVKSCNEALPTKDSAWHCNVEGKQLVAGFVLIPVAAAILGLVTSGLVQLFARKASR